MKRKLTSGVLAAVLALGLCACGTGEEEKNNSSKTKELDAVQFTMEREDASVKDTDGNLILEAFYDRITITDKGDIAEKINAQLKEAGDVFMERAREAVAFAEEMAPYGRVHKHYAKAEVVTNANGILSIRLIKNFYSGGMQDVDTITGMNFNLKTGEKLTLEDVFDMPEERVVEYLKNTTISHAEESGNMQLVSGVNALIGGYISDEHFDYYIQGDVLYLCYPPDSFGPKSMGTIIVECPIK